MGYAARSSYGQAFLAPLCAKKQSYRTFSPVGMLEASKKRNIHISPSMESHRHVNALGSSTEGSNVKKEPFAGFTEVIGHTNLFSDSAIELTMEDMAAREVDFEHYRQRSVGHLRKAGVLAASVITVAFIYTFMSFVRGVMNQQHEKLVSDRYDGSSHIGDRGLSDRER